MIDLLVPFPCLLSVSRRGGAVVGNRGQTDSTKQAEGRNELESGMSLLGRVPVAD